MPNLEGEKVIFAVAQQPFEIRGEGDVVNTFGTLVPVVMADGEAAHEGDFPNAGLVWWMLRPGIRGLASPGRLLKGVLEPAVRFNRDDPQSQYFQVHRDSVTVVEGEDLLEVVTISDDAVNELRDLISGTPVAELNRPPAGVVLIRWQKQVIGPFKTLSTGEGVAFDVRLATLRADQTVTILSDDEFARVLGPARVLCDVDVSLTAQNRGRADGVLHCRYELLIGPGKASFARPEHPRAKLEADADIIRRLAKRLMTRKERQLLGEALDRLRKSTDEVGAEVTAEERRALELLQRQLGSARTELASLGTAIVESGLLGAQIEQAVEQRAASYIENNLAQLQAQVREKIAESSTRLEELEASRTRLESELTERRATAEKALTHELDELRRQSERELEAAAEKAMKLQQGQQALQTQLEAAVAHFKNERALVAAEVMATLAVLGDAPISPQSVGAAPPLRESQPAPIRVAMPAFVTVPAPASQPTEREFFERFQRHASASGFQYRPIDLVSFHLSVKCGDITILGGLSGVGKSSLPRLYADALSGDSAEARGRYHEVAVSPSWLDMRDLLGYVNALDRRFQPAECGLYQHLVFAQEEFAGKGLDSGISLVNMDEMNLAQVEHYFSGFLQALERPAGQRRVACFSATSVVADDPFSAWGELSLPASLRFVGTVNLDETTKQLSLRLLDRSNFIRIRPHLTAAAGVGLSLGSAPVVQGPPVSYRTFKDWVRPPQLPSDLAVVWDEVRRALAELGTTVSPRRQRAIEQFVASARDVTTQEAALDLQVTQRVLPQLRGALTAGARDSLQQLAEVFERREHDFPETRRNLEEMRDRIGDSGEWL